MKKSFSLLFALWMSVVVAQSASADWLRFRGPNGSGISKDKNIPIKWSAEKNLQWKLDMPGKGFSSPIVVGDKVFVNCFSGSRNNLKRYLVCVDRKTGKKLWTKTIPSTNPEFASFGQFSYHGYASSTPASDGKRVFVYCGTSGVFAYDLKGKKLWQKSVGTNTRKTTFGSANSPIVYKDMVIVTASNESATMYAFDAKTGKLEWKSPAASLSGCYGTPVLGKTSDGEPELLLSVTYEVWSLNPANGKLKWYAETNVDGTACTSAIAKDGVVYLVGGKNGGRTAVKIGGKGDAKKNVLWSMRGGTYVPSPVLYDGLLFWVSRRGSLICADAKTGKEVGSKRLSGQYYASPIVIDGKLYVVNRSGQVDVVEADKGLKILARNTFGGRGDFSGTPAVSDGQLFLRSDDALYCISKK